MLRDMRKDDGLSRDTKLRTSAVFLLLIIIPIIILFQQVNSMTATFRCTLPAGNAVDGMASETSSVPGVVTPGLSWSSAQTPIRRIMISRSNFGSHPNGAPIQEGEAQPADPNLFPPPLPPPGQQR